MRNRNNYAKEGLLMNKRIRNALIGAGMLTVGNSYATDLLLRTNYSPSVLHERTVKDVNPVMTVDSNDKITVNEMQLEAKLRKVLEKYTLTIEDRLLSQNGSLNRESVVFDFIDVSEKGEYSRTTNLFKAMFGVGKIGFGAVHMLENEKRNYEQETAGFAGKIKSERKSSSVGPTARLSLYRRGPLIIGFSSDFSYFILNGETQHLAFENKELPGDTEFDRKRDISPFLSETVLEIRKPFDGFINDVGIRTTADYFSKDTAQKSTTEDYVPVYEKYKESRFSYSAELFATIKRMFAVGVGIKGEKRKTSGTLNTTNDSQNRLYGKMQMSLRF